MGIRGFFQLPEHWEFMMPNMQWWLSQPWASGCLRHLRSGKHAEKIRRNKGKD